MQILRETRITFVCALFLTPFVLFATSVVGAQVMQGTNYQIQSDSVNVGGVNSTSTSYTLEDTTGEVATGVSTSSSFTLRAGYQQMAPITIGMTQPASITLDPAIPGLAGGISNGSTSVTVTTDNPAGYEVLVEAVATPAMQADGGTYTIADYVPSGGADYNFAIAATDAHLGYSVLSPDAESRFLHSGSAPCGTGSNNTSQNCWDGLSTTSEPIITGTAANQPSGTESTLFFRVGVGGDVVQAPGSYVATTTLTAVPL
jgi:hypothetical protein